MNHYAKSPVSPALCGAIKPADYPLLTTTNIELVDCPQCQSALDNVDAIRTIDAFQDYLPLSAVRIAPGEYEIRDRSGRALWRMEGASLADWVCASVNGYSAMQAERKSLVSDFEIRYEPKNTSISSPGLASGTSLSEGAKASDVTGGERPALYDVEDFI